MSGLAGAPPGPSGVQRDDHRLVAYLIIAALVALFVAIVVVAVTSLSGGGQPAPAADKRAAELRKLPPWYTVKRGDTYVKIAQRTGLTVDELETFNPYTDPSAIQPGQRLKLRLHVPKPKPKPLGPKYYTLKAGDSYGSIAAKLHKDITRLQRLNPKLKAKELQPGDRARLR